MHTDTRVCAACVTAFVSHICGGYLNTCSFKAAKGFSLVSSTWACSRNPSHVSGRA